MLRSLTTLLVLTGSALCQGLTFGNLYVVRVGDGSATLTSASTPTFVDEYTKTGTFVQTIAMPITQSGANYPLTNAGSSTSEGFLNQSTNGLYLTLAGYATAPGLAAVPTTAASATPRCVGSIFLSGAVDTSTTLTDAYGGGGAGNNGNIRSAVSDDGLQFWTSGNSLNSAGIRYVTLGGTTSVGINAGAPQNTRVAGIHNGQLYTSSSSQSNYGVIQVGTGLPTVGPATLSLLPGMATMSGPSIYDFWFADAVTLYCADDSAGQGGIKKFALIAGIWTLQYTLAAGQPCRGLTGTRAAGVTTLWATTGGSIIRVADTGPSATFSAIATAAPNTAFRGLRLLKRPSTVQRIPASCSPVEIDMAGNAEVGTDIVVTMINPVGTPLISYGLNLLMAPICGTCTLVHDLTFTVVGGQHVFSIPPNPSLAGIAVYAQGVDYLAPGGCTTPFLVTGTDGFVFTIQ